jgi:dihydropteroate synthase
MGTSSLAADEPDRSTAPIARQYRSGSLRAGHRTFCWGERTLVMGIINVTPDSFSGDGVGGDPLAARGLALRMETEGADLLDIGAESSRPGATELDPELEFARLLPALKAVRAATALPLFVDTYHPEVASAALQAGADGVNDIHGLRRDPEMAKVVAANGCPVIAMHNQRGRPPGDVIAAIEAGFCEILGAAQGAGIDGEKVILDPGFGFGWKPEENLEMVRRLPELWSFGAPLLLGVSRKSTIGHVLGLPAEDRLEGTAALVALAVAGGADIVRVHDVHAMKRVVAMADATVRRGDRRG